MFEFDIYPDRLEDGSLPHVREMTFHVTVVTSPDNIDTDKAALTGAWNEAYPNAVRFSQADVDAADYSVLSFPTDADREALASRIGMSMAYANANPGWFVSNP